MTAIKFKNNIEPPILVIQIAQMVQLSAPEDKEALQAAIVERLKRSLDDGKEALRGQFERTRKPGAYLKAHSVLMDTAIDAAFTASGLLQGGDTASASVCCVAAGGYGREEMFPYSDVDLLFLYDPGKQKTAKKIVAAMLYYLWDCGLKIGHAVRSVDEAVALAVDDHTIASALLDRRYICGNASLFEQLDERVKEEIIGKSPTVFVEAKLQERGQRHQRQGNSRFLLEPNIKENKGGLRDLHSLHWLVCYVYGVRSVEELAGRGILSAKEARNFHNAQQFLWQVRIYMHLLSGRAEDRLTFDMQMQLGKLFGYRKAMGHLPVERFMKRYFQIAKMVGDLTRLLCSLLEEEHKRQPRISMTRLLERARQIDDFVLQGQRLNFHSDVDLAKHPLLMLSLFRTAQMQDVDIHPRALQHVSRSLRLINKTLRQDADANRLFLEILLSSRNPEITLRRMNEAGVLGRFIPEFGRVVGQMQYDRYHIYTVDEHTIRAIGILHNIGRGEVQAELPLATTIIHQVNSLRPLYVALLCHDIAKGTGGQHEIKGEKIALRLAARFGLDPQDAERCAWLVREQALFSDVAFKRDMSDPRTIEDFVKNVQSPERLRLLLLLTVCDIRAVGPQIWNGWKGALLRELYQRTEERMGATQKTLRPAVAEQFRQQLQEKLVDWEEKDIEQYMATGLHNFWPDATLDTQVNLAQFWQQSLLRSEQIGFDYQIDRFRAITHILLCLPNQPALMTHIAGSVATISGSILAAKMVVLRDGMVIAMLDIQDRLNHAFEDVGRLKRFRETLVASMGGQLDLATAVRGQQQAYRDPARGMQSPSLVFIDNHSSDQYTIIEVNGDDRIGFLYDVTRALDEMRLTLITSHISTYGEKAVDVFYVKDRFGLKITHPDTLTQVKDAIIRHLQYKEAL